MLLIFWNVSIDVLKKKYKKSKVYNIKKWKLKKMSLYINWRRRNSLVVVLYKRQFHFRSCVCWGSYGGVSQSHLSHPTLILSYLWWVVYESFKFFTIVFKNKLHFVLFLFYFHFIFIFLFEFFKVLVKGFIVWYVVMFFFFMNLCFIIIFGVFIHTVKY
jgi:hypothetical protein